MTCLIQGLPNGQVRVKRYYLEGESTCFDDHFFLALVTMTSSFDQEQGSGGRALIL